MQDLFAERKAIIDELKLETDTMRSSGCQLARNESEYRKAVRIETLKERMEGTPVTITSDLVRGIGYVADLKEASKCAEAMYKSSQEKINVLKIRLRIVEEDINREWQSGGRI